MKFSVGDKVLVKNFFDPKNGSIGDVVNIKRNKGNEVAYIVRFEVFGEWYYKEEDLRPIYE